MPAPTFQYQKTPNYDLPPNAIPLGAIIEEVDFPDGILNKGEIVAIDPVPTPVIQPNWKDKVETKKKGKAGILVKFLEMVGVGGDIGASGNNDSSYENAFDKVITTSFHPDQPYLEEAVQGARIKVYLEASEYAAVYMITGVKVGSGPNSEVKTAMVRAREAHGNIGIHATIYGAPISVGPEASGSTSETRTMSFGGPSDAGDMSDIVIGYRLRKITFEKKADNWVPKSENHFQGAMMGDDTEESTKSSEGRIVAYDDSVLEIEKQWDDLD